MCAVLPARTQMAIEFAPIPVAFGQTHNKNPPNRLYVRTTQDTLNNLQMTDGCCQILRVTSK